ncbi:unnamed protein product [Rotaria sp. Silwood1]|nr:unnamed protein product [Rotaria sp. Silwood1]CAF1686724.1 unnamed protein product [Rotaria sp. Silwood1]
MSLIELQGNKNSGLSVLRTFRLLRVLKLGRFMPTLRRQLVLTQEDWNEVLYNGMENTSAWAALYFIAFMTFGNYVLFNLLVAILVEGFSLQKKWVIILILEVIQIDMEKLIHSKLEELFTGDIDITDNSHDLISNETESHKQTKVKIMSILKKIAISNKNDSSLRVVENQLNKSSNSNNSSPYKSIIKIRSSQLQSLSSSTIQSFHTCIESMDK